MRGFPPFDQNSELQLRDLQAHADREGWQIVETYQDVISGAKANRPGLNRLMADAQARKFDCLLVWKLDRLTSFGCRNIRRRGIASDDNAPIGASLDGHELVGAAPSEVCRERDQRRLRNQRTRRYAERDREDGAEKCAILSQRSL
jgi:predicted site-specific integrase-resolvase